MNARIDESDIKHLQAYRESDRAVVLRKIMSQPPVKRVVLDGKNDFEKTLLKLRRDGFGLIDLQSQETACASVWCRSNRALLKRLRRDVAMLVWEAQEHGEVTTIMTWRV